MDYQFDSGAKFCEKRIDGRGVANIDGAVAIVSQAAFELSAIPGGGAVGAKEILAHVVIDADDVETMLVEEASRFAADKAGRAGDQDDAQRADLLSK